MNKITKYSWWALMIIFFAVAFGVYVNNDYKINNSSYSDNLKDKKQEIDQDYINKNKECFAAYEK